VDVFLASVLRAGEKGLHFEEEVEEVGAQIAKVFWRAAQEARASADSI
jgi:hypothetical protein